MLDFSLIGYGGYVSPRHITAIKDTGNKLISGLDFPNSETNALKEQFPNAALFTSFDSYKEYHNSNVPDYITICTPNDQHFEYIKWALETGAHVICEKPIVTDPDLLFPLLELEQSTGKKVNTILQLRSLKQMIELKKEVENSKHRYQIDLSYFSSRDEHYFRSWKADLSRSGGLITNIGIHLFDLVLWIFGGVKNSYVFKREMDHASGFLELDKADVRWMLDIKGDMASTHGVQTFRELKLNGMPLRLDSGLESLHRISYEDIITGKGWGIKDAFASISLCSRLNYLEISRLDSIENTNS